MKKIFITGTDTDVGKTVAAAVLTQALQACYWKPIQAGTQPCTDSQTVARLVSHPNCRILPETYLLHTPASPHHAAAIEGVNLQLEAISVPPNVQHQHLIIEGAGGAMVPINEQHLMIDLMRHLQARAVVVAGQYLGSINHTLLTIDALQRHHIPIVGIIINAPQAAYQHATDYVLQRTGLPCIATLSHTEPLTPHDIAQFAQQINLDLF